MDILITRLEYARIYLEKLEKDNNLFWNQVFPYSEYFLPLYGLESHHVRCTR